MIIVDTFFTCGKLGYNGGLEIKKKHSACCGCTLDLLFYLFIYFFVLFCFISYDLLDKICTTLLKIIKLLQVQPRMCSCYIIPSFCLTLHILLVIFTFSETQGTPTKFIVSFCQITRSIVFHETAVTDHVTPGFKCQSSLTAIYSRHVGFGFSAMYRQR